MLRFHCGLYIFKVCVNILKSVLRVPERLINSYCCRPNGGHARYWNQRFAYFLPQICCIESLSSINAWTRIFFKIFQTEFSLSTVRTFVKISKLTENFINFQTLQNDSIYAGKYKNIVCSGWVFYLNIGLSFENTSVKQIKFAPWLLGYDNHVPAHLFP